MVEPAKRSRSLRKVSYRTPGGKTKKRYLRRKSVKATCGACGKKLAGVSTDKKLSKSQKKPGRKFSGNLCHSCTTYVLKLQTRIDNKDLERQAVSIKYRKYLK